MSLRKRISKLFSLGRRKKKGRRPPVLESKQLPMRRTSEGRYPTYRSSQQREGWFRWFTRRVLLYGFIGGTLVVAWFAWDLPDINDLNKFTKAPSILIKTEDGQIIGSFGDIYGDYVPFSELPASLVDAVIATEDRNFYHHFGIDPFGLIRATFANIRARHVVQGGSTITQQVAKNVFLTPERSFVRKIKEMMLAIRLEQRFSKQDIISIYLNRVYLGAGNYGVDAAAHRYFDKSARDLTLGESAILAGMLKAPSRYAPTSNPTLSRQRAEQVLLSMSEAGFLTEKQSAKARADLVKAMSARKKTSQSMLYFADWIIDQVPEYVGNVQEDLVVITTLRPEWQAIGEKAINDVMDKEGPSHDASQAALLSMTPDGAVRAMIGGRSYAASQFNRTFQSLRQPGSSFKLFVYLAGLEDGMRPDMMVEDQPVAIPIVGGTWTPKNYTGKYLGTLTLKEAVTQSINTVAVQVAMQVGLDKVVNMARRLGITSDLQELPSIALGSTEVSLLELTAAYAHLAAGGSIVYPYGIVEIDTTKGQPIYERQASRIGVVLSPAIVGEMNEMLISVVENGTGRAARFGRPMAGKTGTTSDYKDAWFMGYTPDLVTGVWVGNDDNTAMKKVTGGMLPASIWHNFMSQAMEKIPPRGIPTSGSSDVVLPWQEGTPFPQQPGLPQQPGNGQQAPILDPDNLLPQDNAPRPVADPENLPPPSMLQQVPPVQRKPVNAPKDVNLGPGFWDKLMGDDKQPQQRQP